MLSSWRISKPALVIQRGSALLGKFVKGVLVALHHGAAKRDLFGHFGIVFAQHQPVSGGRCDHFVAFAQFQLSQQLFGEDESGAGADGAQLEGNNLTIVFYTTGSPWMSMKVRFQRVLVKKFVARSTMWSRLISEPARRSVVVS